MQILDAATAQLCIARVVSFAPRAALTTARVASGDRALNRASACRVATLHYSGGAAATWSVLGGARAAVAAASATGAAARRLARGREAVARVLASAMEGPAREAVPAEETRPTKQAKTGSSAGIGMVWGAPEEGPVVPPEPGESVLAPLTYQGDAVPRSLLATGQVRTMRDGSGSDGEYFGCDFVRRDVLVTNGRGREFSLDAHGFTLVEDKREHINYFDEAKLLQEYYPACCELVKRVTGASRVFAFDHNVRSKKLSDMKEKLTGGSAVQGPAFVVHNDYTVTSAPRRVRDLAKAPKANDTMRKVLGDRPLIDPAEVDELLAGRWAFINMWRNIKSNPVEKLPLALCEGPTVPLEDIVTFEIHYADRVGENYFAGKSADHKWFYFPKITRDEVVLLKCWDSAGAAFAADAQPRRVPATFSFHTAFEDPSTAPDADDRESIEVRTITFFPAEGTGAAA